ncbi:hypothetical protein [Nitrosovibrio sp. Nv6]|uniref:hypothetical protein n=1 Tax=Nitrosovibrio sp. Nv6 TaxID=1855340 RepID=UPI0008B0B59D|nr:hypothetical protein [Nitrosovibrio sp. Nv6]SEO88547.1 hypothetical protein SAMN05216316_1364 [Nitrosovibrio sp. Nv6]
MITVFGLSDTEESGAAKALESAILLAWPWIADSETSTIALIPNVQCYGQQTRDVDLVVLADIAEHDLPMAVFRPGFRSSSRAGLHFATTKISVQSLCLVIEVKDHPEQNVRFDGGRVSVFYSNGKKWHDASRQSENQKYALKGYIQHHNVVAPWITNLIWLRNIERNALPNTITNLLPARVTWTDLLNAVIVNYHPRKEGNVLILDHEPSVAQAWSVRACEKILARRQEPTALDRLRVEAVCKGSLDKRLLEVLGNRMVLLSGRGGTGKTIILLRLAYKYSLAGLRTILLTYNRALKSDIERLLVLTGIRDDIAEGTVQVYTVQSFIFKLLKLVGIVDSKAPEDFLQDYEGYLGQALDYLKNGALTRDDISALIVARPEEFSWDLVLLDEAQDWPDLERDFVRTIYPSRKFVVADGRDQLIRQNRNCDWKVGLRNDEYELVQCARSFRLKRNLAHFANRMAMGLGLLHWELDENDDIPGGRVIIVEGDYFANQGLHGELVEACSLLGNKPIDMLACVPSRDAADDRDSCADKADKFLAVGQPLWNGTDAEVRRLPPSDLSQLRLVRYESCRGLEGWTVINFGFDRFYDHKLALAKKSAPMNKDGISDPALWATRFAATWAMIPLTRAIDTIVIEVSRNDSRIKSALRRIQDGGSADFISWMVT